MYEDEVNPRRYVEAYRRLLVAAALKALAKGRPGLVWHDEHGEVIGGGAVSCPSQDTLLFRYGLYTTRRAQGRSGVRPPV